MGMYSSSVVPGRDARESYNIMKRETELLRPFVLYFKRAL